MSWWQSRPTATNLRSMDPVQKLRTVAAHRRQSRLRLLRKECCCQRRLSLQLPHHLPQPILAAHLQCQTILNTMLPPLLYHPHQTPPRPTHSGREPSQRNSIGTSVSSTPNSTARTPMPEVPPRAAPLEVRAPHPSRRDMFPTSHGQCLILLESRCIVHYGNMGATATLCPSLQLLHRRPSHQRRPCSRRRRRCRRRPNLHSRCKARRRHIRRSCVIDW